VNWQRTDGSRTRWQSACVAFEILFWSALEIFRERWLYVYSSWYGEIRRPSERSLSADDSGIVRVCILLGSLNCVRSHVSVDVSCSFFLFSFFESLPTAGDYQK
jgi:hypothetical protein